MLGACMPQPTPTPVPTPTITPMPKVFDGKYALNAYLVPQMNFGARPVGSAAAKALAGFIAEQFDKSKWKVETQDFAFRGIPGRNVIAKTGAGKGALIVIGAHYDTRIYADMDKTSPKAPVMGANDGASGVAVLLELARSLDTSKLKNEVWLAFFDAEDNGGLTSCDLISSPTCDKETWDFAAGADYVAGHLPSKPEAVVVVDMIGDADQNIYYEHNSDAELQKQLWAIAARLGYTRQFIAEYKWSMDDDHTPFLQRGMRAIDIIDFDYPYWHTTQDTADKVSADSLERVGRVLQTWLENK